MKTSIDVNRKIWTDFKAMVIVKTGSARKISVEVENALELYMSTQEDLIREKAVKNDAESVIPSTVRSEV